MTKETERLWLLFRDIADLLPLMELHLEKSDIEELKGDVRYLEEITHKALGND